MMIRSLVLPFAVVALSLAGCQAKLSVSRTIKVPDGAEVAKAIEMPAQPGAQTVTVTVKVTAGSPVDVFVLKASEVGDAIAGDKKEKQAWEAKAIASKTGLTAGTVVAKVPANTAFKVVVVLADLGKEPATVDLKITN